MPYDQLAELKENIQFLESLHENFGNAQGKPSLLILNDLLNQVYSKAVCDLFTKGSHHRNASVKLVMQKLKGYFTKRKIHGGIEERSRQESAYFNATSRPHGYIVFDIPQDTSTGSVFELSSFQTSFQSPCIPL